MKVLLSIALLSSLSAFALTNPAPALIESAKVLANSDLSCAQDADCKAIATGSRACGGPNGYIIASENNVNLDVVEYIAKQSTEKEKQYNREAGVFSICSYEMPPTLKCASNKCAIAN